MKRFWPWWALVAVAVLFQACSYWDTKQRELIFRPVKEDSRGNVGLLPLAEEVWIPVASDERGTQRLHAWWLPANDHDAPALLYLHGSRWNLSGYATRLARYQGIGFSVLAIDYRGFGRSDGDLPSEAQVYEDAQSAWNYLKTKVAADQPRYLYGHSLGGAVAIELATKNVDAAGLIVESTFTSINDIVGSSKWGFLPVGWLITQHFDSLAKISHISMPLLVIHGTADRLIPYTMGERLFKAAPGPKKLVLVDGAGHSNISAVAYDQLQGAVKEFLKSTGVQGKKTTLSRADRRKSVGVGL